LEIFRFERNEWRVTRHDSFGLSATRIAAGEGPISLTCLNVEPGGTIGTHPAPTPQMLLITAGDGWVAGPDGQRVPITAGQGVCWNQGEEHTSGTQNGFTALAVEGTPMSLYQPKAPNH
jgi:hypothetical protein